MSTDHQPAEEVEFIPWSDLVARHQESRPWLAYLVAGAVVAAALGAVGARAVWRPEATATPTSASAVAEEVPAPPPVTTLPLYSEADLLAGSDDRDHQWAATRAEWFVTDYFTADAEPGGSTAVRAALPEGGPLPPFPQDDPGGGLSYVEWARAFRVERLGEGLFRVAVAYRALGAPAEGAFRRLPVRAVEVVVAVGPDGASAVTDLPAPAPLPADLEPGGWPAEGAPAPPAVLEAALAQASEWGESPEVLSSTGAGAGWRVVVSVADSAGTRWPLALWLDETGVVPSPPWLEP
ncbi:MAG: hypothetical protein ACRDXD_13950 [Acidimicrobiia bacterium]